MNVAVTRARKKLIIFGSKSTLQSSALFQEFFDMALQRNWLFTLPSKAQNVHTMACLIRQICPHPSMSVASQKPHQEIAYE